MSHKAKVREWLTDAQKRLELATPGSAWYRVNEKIIREYEELLARLGDKPERQPGEDSLFP
jgi:hypothetical protein